VRVTNRVKFAALTVRYLAFKAEQGRAVVGNCSFRIQANVWRTAKPVHPVETWEAESFGRTRLNV
jgi:hypothetical protein